MLVQSDLIWYYKLARESINNSFIKFEQPILFDFVEFVFFEIFDLSL